MKIHVKEGLCFEKSEDGKQVIMTKYNDARCMYGPVLREIIPVENWNEIVECMAAPYEASEDYKSLAAIYPSVPVEEKPVEDDWTKIPGVDNVEVDKP